MKKIGSGITEEEKKAEAFLTTLGAPIHLPSCTYASGIAPVASPSYHGVESFNWHVASKGEGVDCFLRITRPELKVFIDFQTALTAAQTCHDLSFSPKVLAVDADNHAMLFEYLGEDWQVATLDALMVPDMAEKLVTMQKQLAAASPFGRRWSVFDGIADFYDRLQTLDGLLPPDIDWMMAWVEVIRDAIQASGIDFKPAHGDPHSSNILLDAHKNIQLVDFDMAGDMDPYYSLGVLMNELYVFEEEMRPLLEIHDGVVRESIFCRARAYAVADDFYWALRAFFMQNCLKNPSIEFLKYGCWRALRCRMALSHPDFERIIRNIS